MTARAVHPPWLALGLMLALAGWFGSGITAPVLAAAPLRAELGSPAPGSTLPGSSVTFGWTGGRDVHHYHVWVGPARGAWTYYEAAVGTSRSLALENLPVDGRDVWVRLWSCTGPARCELFHDARYEAA